MATPREKQLAITLLKERIEHLTGKKVILKENEIEETAKFGRRGDPLNISLIKAGLDYLTVGNVIRLIDADTVIDQTNEGDWFWEDSSADAKSGFSSALDAAKDYIKKNSHTNRKIIKKVSRK